jgi:2,3-bisphosphoglycerate-dependent phosphoglycerate mutase
MKRSPMILIAAAVLLSPFIAWSDSRPVVDEPTTTIFLVRHAEKQAESGDPSLSEKGRTRAKALARTLADVEVTGLSATPYRRTQQTLEPLAEGKGLEIEVLQVDLSDPGAYARDLASGLLERYHGGTVVVSGHSNTVPLLLEALGVAGPRSLGDDEYDDLFLVQVVAGKPAVMFHLHYGDPSP